MKAMFEILALANKLEMDALRETDPVKLKASMQRAAAELAEVASNVAARWGTLTSVITSLEKD